MKLVIEKRWCFIAILDKNICKSCDVFLTEEVLIKLTLLHRVVSVDSTSTSFPMHEFLTSF